MNYLGLNQSLSLVESTAFTRQYRQWQTSLDHFQKETISKMTISAETSCLTRQHITWLV